MSYSKKGQIFWNDGVAGEGPVVAPFTLTVRGSASGARAVQAGAVENVVCRLLSLKKPYDILLQELPLAYSVVSFSWMEKPIDVTGLT